jgi:two-component system response regulator YesN
MLMNGARATLLIVDDDPSCREAFCLALEDEYLLIETDSGNDALNILTSGQNIDLMLLDYLLPPGIDGLEALERMRELKCEVPVIIVTGKGSEDICRNAFKLGVQDYIQKPFKVDELRAAIKEILDPFGGAHAPVDRAVAFMTKNYSKPISAANVAREIGFSHAHLSHLFKKEKGCSISFHLNHIRIHRAKSLLTEDPYLRVKEIAFKVGFQNVNYFYRVFKKIVGISAAEYRKRST